MSVAELERHRLTDVIDAACERIAPLWPLNRFVAVNPFYGLRHEHFWTADAVLRRLTGTGLTMPRAFYRDAWASGRIDRRDLAGALAQLKSPWSVETVEAHLGDAEPPGMPAMALFSDVLGRIEGRNWTGFVTERLSRFCAAYFDTGQALWPMPDQDTSLYAGWRAYARYDRTPAMAGLKGVADILAGWPDCPDEAILRAVTVLGVPEPAVADYAHAALLSIGGWVGWTRYRAWEARLAGGSDPATRELLAARLTWEAVLYQVRHSAEAETAWQEAVTAWAAPPPVAVPATHVEAILQTAYDLGYQRMLRARLAERPHLGRAANHGLAAQAIFCIDGRSEPFRRALEAVAPHVRTEGFAGFFGLPVAYQPVGAGVALPHLPVFFAPAYRVGEEAPARLQSQERLRRRLAKVWKAFKMSAASTFAFVEGAGLWSLLLLVGESVGWTRTAPHPERGPAEWARVRPALDPGAAADAFLTGIPAADRVAIAATLLQNLGLTDGWDQLVLFVGHGSTTTNNPHASALDCGACGGQSGAPNARIAAVLLNDPVTREGLAARGISIPESTYFLAAVHDTATETVMVLDGDRVPVGHRAATADLIRALAEAGEVARREHAARLDVGAAVGTTLARALGRRARNWAEVRPEWGLAGNAAFIAAPRHTTQGRALDGRVFLHEYDWRRDGDFRILEQIMTAPLIVAHWINMQYYGSVVDNSRWGSGNKVLHNVVGGTIGVLEGNGGDLRTGLPWQSLHDGAHWVHEPVRLTVLIRAPRAAIDDILHRHAEVRELVDHEWLTLVEWTDDGSWNRRQPDGGWRPTDGVV